MEVTPDFYAILQTTLLLMLGIIGWFLRGIYANIQKMADSIQSLNERLIRHEEKNTTVDRHLDILDREVRENEQEINLLKLKLAEHVRN
jgi:peptidoglycan hydrolase CwlO-like protein